MSSWNQGYITDIPYTYGYYRDLSPSLLRFALLFQGYDAPGSSANYCEIASGKGLSANIHASANPEIQFVATDFNPTHTAEAQRLAQEAGTQNITFYDESIENFHQKDLPSFDFICLHGFYSWVGASTRQAIVDFIATKLKVGGVVYISYNCLPGWAVAIPLRELLSQYAAHSPEAFPARVRESVEFAQWLMDTGAGYFVQNPEAGLRLKRIRESNQSYVAHEYFNQHWTPLFFSQVSGNLHEAKLSFATSVNLVDQIDAVSLGPEIQQKLSSFGNLDFRETLKDFIVNRQFRRDIYVRGPLRLSSEERRERLLEQRFVLAILPGEFELKQRFPRGEVTLQAQIYQPVIEALADGPLKLGELMARPTIQDLPFDGVAQALAILVGIGYVEPAGPESGEAQHQQSTELLNKTILRRAQFTNEINYLASPVTGGGCALDRLEQLFLLARSQEQEPVKFTWSILKQQGQRMVKDDSPLEGEVENLAAIEQAYQKFESEGISRLKRLGIL